jgi:DNA-binding GntR family transcriptional regulator
MSTAEVILLAGQDEPKDDNGEGSYQRAYRGIVYALFEGRLIPGQRLSEPDLMRQFRTGRGTIREVLNRLAAEGIVSLVRHRGAAINMLSRRQAVDLLEVVAVLFGLAGRLAAQRVHEGCDFEADLARALADVVAERRGATPSNMAIVEKFYRTVMNLAGNREVRSTLPAMKVYILRAQMRPFEEGPESFSVSDFKLVTQAILSGDAGVAEMACRAHVGNTLKRVATVPDRAFSAEN